MCKEIAGFGHIEIEKYKFYRKKNPNFQMM